MGHKPGARVWAVRNANETTVYAFGFGTYAGDFPRPGWTVSEQDRLAAEAAIRRNDDEQAFDKLIDAWAEADVMSHDEADQRRRALVADRARPIRERVDEMLRALSLNPKIVLDGGGVVWGCECWWGEADDATPAAFAKGREIIIVPAPHLAGDPQPDVPEAA